MLFNGEEVLITDEFRMSLSQFVVTSARLNTGTTYSPIHSLLSLVSFLSLGGCDG